MIPNELKLEILEKITTLDDLLNLCKTSKTFYNLCKQNPMKTKIINMKRSEIKDILIKNWKYTYNIDFRSEPEVNAGKAILNENPSTDDEVDEIVNRHFPFMNNSILINDIKKYYIHLKKIKMEQLTINAFSRRNFKGPDRYKRYELEKIANDLKIKFDENDTNYDIYMNITMKLTPINLYLTPDPTRDWDTYENQSILKFIAKQFNVKYDENTNLYKTLLLFFAAGNKKWIGKFYSKNYFGGRRFRRFELVEMANYFGISTNDDMTNRQIFDKITAFFTRTTMD